MKVKRYTFSPAFFKNPDDAFISGLLKSRRGTCSSYAPLIVALGRRLGYPLHLKATNGHLLCYWDDGKESFNVDTNGEGVDMPADEHYDVYTYELAVRFSKVKDYYSVRPSW